MSYNALPAKQGLYDPQHEHDACGVGFIAHIKGQKSHAIIRQGLDLLRNLTHRGAVGADPLAGDGAGILIQIPDAFLREECAELGITNVWMHRGPGAGSVSDTATSYGRQHGITVIDGGCPCMFGPTADFGHKVMRFVYAGHVPKQV